MGRIFDAVQQFLDGENIRHEAAGGMTASRFAFRTEKHAWTCVVEVREAQGFLLFASLVPETVPEARRAAVAELITRINAGLAVGNFDMDWDGGQVRFRTSVDLEGTEASAPLLRQLLRANLSSTARFLAAIEQVAGGASTALEALQTVG